MLGLYKYQVNGFCYGLAHLFSFETYVTFTQLYIKECIYQLVHNVALQNFILVSTTPIPKHPIEVNDAARQYIKPVEQCTYYINIRSVYRRPHMKIA